MRQPPRSSNPPRVFSTSSDSDLICRGSYYLRKTLLNNVRVGGCAGGIRCLMNEGEEEEEEAGGEPDGQGLARFLLNGEEPEERRRPPF